VRTFKVPIAGAIIVAVGLAYANYKFEQFKRTLFGWINTAQETAQGIFETASGGLKSVKDAVSKVQPPAVETPQSVKDGLKSVKDAVSKIQLETPQSVKDGLKSVKDAVSKIQPPALETPQSLKDLFSSSGPKGGDK